MTEPHVLTSVPKTFQHKPLTVEAMVYDGTGASARAIQEWAGQEWETTTAPAFNSMMIPVYGNSGSHAVVRARSGDVIVKWADGTFSPINPEEFFGRYEDVV